MSSQHAAGTYDAAWLVQSGGGSRALGVRRHRIVRPIDDPNYVVVELDFETTEQAEACRAALDRLWASRAAAPALLGTPRTRIVEAIEDRRY